MDRIPRAKESDLFGAAALPDGLVYRPQFIGEEDEAALLAAIRGLPLHQALYRQYTAKRRIVSYGAEYDFSARELKPGPAVPEIFLPLREQVAAWLKLPAEQLTHALVTEYSPGTQLGWHRDTPEFGVVAGISLAGACRMRWRRYPPEPRPKALALELERRSAYVMQGDARWRWQHSIPPTKVLRYSITFRTLRNPELRTA